MKRMAKGSGNGGRGGDLIVNLHAEVVELRATLSRNHREAREAEAAMARHHREMEAVMARHHRETDHHLLRIGRMLSHVGDRLNDHEQRLTSIEEKVG